MTSMRWCKHSTYEILSSFILVTLSTQANRNCDFQMSKYIQKSALICGILDGIQQSTILFYHSLVSFFIFNIFLPQNDNVKVDLKLPQRQKLVNKHPKPNASSTTEALNIFYNLISSMRKCSEVVYEILNYIRWKKVHIFVAFIEFSSK